MKRSKLTLGEIKIKSFVTTMRAKDLNNLNGGTICPSINACPFSDTIEPLIETETCSSTGTGADPTGGPQG